MAKKGRKAQYINKLTKKDQNMLRAFRNVGHLSQQQLTEQLGMSQRRIENFIRDKHIQTVEVFDKDTKSVVKIYTLTDKGKEFTQQQLNLNNFYKSVSVKHDLALAHTYLNATPEKQENWLTEKDWKDRFEEKIAQLKEDGQLETASDLQERFKAREISLPDGGYAQGGAVVAVEITTNNYGKAEIQAKIEFSEVMNVQYQSYRI